MRRLDRDRSSADREWSTRSSHLHERSGGNKLFLGEEIYAMIVISNRYGRGFALQLVRESTSEQFKDASSFLTTLKAKLLQHQYFVEIINLETPT